MSERRISVPFGKQPLTFTLPDGWDLAGTFAPAEYPPVHDAAAACAAGLAEPLGMPPLRELARNRRKIAIVVEDVSRPTPIADFFGPIIDALDAAQVPDEAVTIVTALGVHRPMTEAEVKAKIGERAFGRYRWINHDFEPGDHLEMLGTTRRGTPCWINREVSQADLVIGVGCIEPHIIASFGGGSKILVPGVAGKETVAKTHRRNTTPQTFNNVGLDPYQNPMRQDLEECVAMIKAPIFIVDAVLRGDLSVAQILAGDRDQVYRAGIEAAARIFGVKVPGLADIVITSSHPMNVDMRQGAKSLANTIRALRRGGTMLCLMAAEQGVGDFPVPEKRPPVGKRGLKVLSHVLIPLMGVTTLGMQEEAHFFTYFSLQAIKNYNVIFYAPTISPDVKRRLPFYDMHANIDEALAAAARLTPRGRVFVFPNGGVTYPIVEGDN
ncbi:MAG: nickel-dependent lactate racemase [Candidatus Lernaella stagnicola]|nr:nickel-dependent lactate racemase [Candidatus Lernaella stagnicola]